tara:strand:- start:6 stop:239 length:234 start_codon:yes stop_codon:yes gene_type:complete
MKVKHLKTKTVIELTPQELDKYMEYLKELDNATSTLHECGELWLSDLTKLDNLEWRLRDLLGLEFDRETWKYKRKTK